MGLVGRKRNRGRRTVASVMLAGATLASVLVASTAPSIAAPADSGVGAADESVDVAAQRARLTEERVRRVFPTAEEVGSDPTDDYRAPGVPLVCLRQGTGPASTIGISRVYRIEDAWIQVYIRTYPDEATARTALRAQRRDVLTFCDDTPYFGYHREYRRARVPLRDFGDQRWGFVRDFVPVDEGWAAQVGIEGAYRVGRHLVIYETTESSVRVSVPDTSRAAMRQILTIVRENIASLPGA